MASDVGPDVRWGPIGIYGPEGGLPFAPYRSLSISKLFCSAGGCGHGGVEGFVMNSQGISGGEGGGGAVHYEFIMYPFPPPPHAVHYEFITYPFPPPSGTL